MENKEDTGINSCHDSATGLDLRCISSKTDDFPKWPSLSVESSFSYLSANSEKSSKTRKVAGSPHKHVQITTAFQNGISKAQGVNEVVKSQSKTVSTTEGKGKNCLDKDKQDFKSDLSLTGKRLPLFPERWSPDYTFRLRSGSDTECGSSTESSEENRLNPGLNTSNISSLCTHEVNPRSNANFFNNNRHRPPAFTPRPLGQAWVGCADRQKAWTQEANGPPDNILASGLRQPLRTRQRIPPRYTPSAHLRRTASSYESVRHIPRTRSASLPVPSKLHESRMVMEWNEKRTGGVTYVTPVLNTLSDGDLSCYSSTKTEDKL